MSRITYLLGAGASIEKMPVVSGFDEYFESSILNLKSYIAKQIPGQSLPDDERSLKLGHSIEHAKEIVDLYNALQRFRRETKDHFSIDTLAKILWFQHHPDYELVKIIISILMLNHQVLKGVDRRYEAFLASILKKSDTGIDFPDNLNIYSWNYDFQFEEAVYKVSNELAKKYLENYYSESFQGINSGSGFYYEKLNRGSGRAYFDDSSSSLSLNLDKLSQDRNDSIYNSYPVTLNHYLNLIKNGTQEITFAWEKNREEIQNSFKYLKGSKILVVVGYSFPNFNSEVDLEFFKQSRFKKIYIQCAKQGFEVKERIQALQEVASPSGVGAYTAPEPIIIEGTNEFYLPKSFFFSHQEPAK